MSGLDVTMVIVLLDLVLMHRLWLSVHRRKYDSHCA
jgi:hypothetical protein